jgi:hypothetical protein
MSEVEGAGPEVDDKAPEAEGYEGPSIFEVAAALAAALRSGNSQHSESALAAYEAWEEDGVDGSALLGPLKRTLSPEEAASVSEVGGGTEQDQEDAAVNASDSTPATTTIDAGAEHSLADIAQPVSEPDDNEVDGENKANPEA